ncbi:hypothetical protein HHI36_014729 [Cryptolaemus montrouzieri]|uniref:C2H2-type domain-containing protein n=1 Tax=Cryptolaemus montrouzieri TaxID=559131 RepID=A0ABD2N4G4_9CUCU
MRRISLNSHIAIHTKNKPYICSNCGKSFAIKSELTIHKKIHSDQYQCNICFKTFVVPSKLQRHLRTHTNERPYQCPYEVCKKMFTDQSNLSEHINTHKSMRDIKCRQCDKHFKTKNQLRSHMLTHNFNTYTCDICKKSYRYKTNLILHMKKHTGYKCSFCDKNCETFSVFMRHRQGCIGK